MIHYIVYPLLIASVFQWNEISISKQARHLIVVIGYTDLQEIVCVWRSVLVSSSEVASKNIEIGLFYHWGLVMYMTTWVSVSIAPMAVK